MGQAITMPKFGQTVEEATIVEWRKQEGDTVSKGDILFTIETDKAVLETESFFDGTLLKIFVPAGEPVPVGSQVGFLGEPGEEVPEPAALPAPPAQKPAPAAAAPATPVVAAPQPVPSAAQAAAAPAPTAPVASVSAEPSAPAPRHRLSPRARALVRERLIDPSPIEGTGQSGRVTERDVLAYLDTRGYDRLRVSAGARALARKESIDLLAVRGTGEGGRIRVADIERAIAERPREMSKMRQVIAERLTASFTGTPHFYVTVAADMTDLLALRAELKEAGRGYTVTAYILKAVALTLAEFPMVNSMTDGHATRWYGSVDLGMAVSVENGLVVPVLKCADEMSMTELSETAADLAARARDGKLTPDEMTGSTFTVSNMGMLGVENFSAIINPGESAILAIASTVQMPVVREGEIVVRAIMKMTLSADHRIVDGAMGAAFANAVKDKLEDMELWKRLTLL